MRDRLASGNPEAQARLLPRTFEWRPRGDVPLRANQVHPKCGDWALWRTNCKRCSNQPAGKSETAKCEPRLPMARLAWGAPVDSGGKHWSRRAPRAHTWRVWRGCGGFRSLPATASGELALAGECSGREWGCNDQWVTPSASR
jgi:hypothetical protein